MKALAVFFAVVLLVVGASCTQDETEVTREIEVTRVVKETVIFDVDAEKAELESVSNAWSDAYLNPDCTVRTNMADEDFEWFIGNYAWQGIVAADDFVSDLCETATKITIESMEWMIAPELAVSRSLETWAWPDGSSGNYLLTTVWKKTDGQWVAIHGHSSQYEP